MYLLLKSRYLKGTPELRAKYDAFYRVDVDNWNFLTIFVIQFITFIPKWIFIWAIMGFWVIFA